MHSQQTRPFWDYFACNRSPEKFVADKRTEKVVPDDHLVAPEAAALHKHAADVQLLDGGVHNAAARAFAHDGKSLHPSDPEFKKAVIEMRIELEIPQGGAGRYNEIVLDISRNLEINPVRIPCGVERAETEGVGCGGVAALARTVIGLAETNVVIPMITACEAFKTKTGLGIAVAGTAVNYERRFAPRGETTRRRRRRTEMIIIVIKSGMISAIAVKERLTMVQSIGKIPRKHREKVENPLINVKRHRRALASRKLFFVWIFLHQGFYLSFTDLNMAYSDAIAEFHFLPKII
jgi:hypothetical protein